MKVHNKRDKRSVKKLCDNIFDAGHQKRWTLATLNARV